MKADEGCTMSVYNLLQVFVKIFRFTELCIALAFLFWTFSRLPLVFRISSGYVSQLSGFFASPVFGFILCNTIVVTLITKPHRFSGYRLISDRVETELFNELVKSGTRNSLSPPGNESNGHLFADPETEEIAYEDKEVISEVSTAAAFTEKMDPGTNSESGLVSPIQYRRMKWDYKLKQECSEMGGERFRRFETEEKETMRRGGGHSPESLCCRDELSNKEFQRRIEAFIARELRFRRSESVTVVQSERCL